MDVKTLVDGAIVTLVAVGWKVLGALALWLVAARVVQSCIHLASLSVWAVNLRFTAFAVQTGIAVYWTWRLLTG